MSSMRARSRRWPVWARLVLAGGLLAVVLDRIPVSEVIEPLGRVVPAFFLAALILSLINRYVAAHRTALLARAQGLPLKARELCEISLTTSFYGLVLPGVLAGGAVRWYKLSRAGGSSTGALSVIALDRFLDTLTLVALGSLLWSLDAATRSVPAVGVALFALLCLLIPLYAATVLLPFPRNALEGGGRLRSLLSSLMGRLGAFRELPVSSHASLLAISVLRELSGILVYWWLARALGLEVSFISIGWIRAALLLLTLLPLSFAGLGVREVSLIFLLAPCGIAAGDALGLSVLVFLGVLWVAAIGGLLEARRSFLVGSAVASER